MKTLEELQTKLNKWKQISEELKPICKKLAPMEENREEGFYKLQIRMLYNKALEYVDRYEHKIKRIQ